MMMQDKKFHFISGLPRSGSTLLSACLRQNPLFDAGMTSPVGSICLALRSMISQNPELDALVSEPKRHELLNSIFKTYYSDYDRQVIFDTNRSWSSRIPELNAIFDDVKVIAMVRDPAWILDSLETITRKNPIRQSHLFKPGMSIDSRTSSYLAPEGMIGSAMSALKEGLFGAESKQMMLIEYDAFCAQPNEVLDAIYDFVGEDRFKHDLTNVEYKQDVFDVALRTPGLHTVSGAIKKRDRKTILPPDTFEKCSAMSFWRGSMNTDALRVIL